MPSWWFSFCCSSIEWPYSYIILQRNSKMQLGSDLTLQSRSKLTSPSFWILNSYSLEKKLFKFSNRRKEKTLAISGNLISSKETFHNSCLNKYANNFLYFFLVGINSFTSCLYRLKSSLICYLLYDFVLLFYDLLNIISKFSRWLFFSVCGSRLSSPINKDWKGIRSPSAACQILDHIDQYIFK